MKKITAQKKKAVLQLSQSPLESKPKILSDLSVVVKREESLIASPGQILSAKSVYDSLKKAQPTRQKLSVSTNKLKEKKSSRKNKKAKAIATLKHSKIAKDIKAKSSSTDKTSKLNENSPVVDSDTENLKLNGNGISDEDNHLEIASFEEQPSPSSTENDDVEEMIIGDNETNPLQAVYQTLDKFEYHLINSNEALVIIPFQTCFYFKGRLCLTVLSGTAELQGFTFEQDSNKMHQIFSPRGYSLQCIRAVGKSTISMNSHVITFVAKAIGRTEDYLKKKTTDNALLILRPLNCNMIEYVSRLFPINILRKEECIPPDWDDENRNRFNQLCNLLDASIILRGSVFSARFYGQPDVWTEYVQYLSSKLEKKETIRLMLLGGKGVGKSTLLRFLVNQLIQQCGAVLVVDFDPGQPELFPAGSVSASLVSSPFLGPNFTHLQQPLYTYFVGDADIVGCPERYVRSCRQILNDCRMDLTLGAIPTIINTMGFTSGIGLDVTLDLIRYSQPHQILQISSRSPRRNFPALLDHEFVTQHQRGWLTNGYCDTLPEYELQAIYSSSELSEKSLEEWGFRPSELRQIGLMSYFSKLSSGPEWSLMDAAPYRISWQELAVCICHESVPPSLTMGALNASLVALCVLDSDAAASVSYYQATTGQYPKILREMPLMPCVGYGFVRGIDTTQGYVYLVSPEPADRLARVNCLVMGGVRLPESLLLDASLAIQRNKDSTPKVRIPYATFGPSVSQPACRPYRKYNPVFTLRNVT